MTKIEDFKDSQEAHLRRMVRAAIRGGIFTKGERDVILALVNHWFHHKNGPKKFIHPGRVKIAKKAKVSVRTTASTFAMLRASGVIKPLNGLSGGGKIPTKYVVELWPLMSLCGVRWVDDFLNGLSVNVPLSESKMSHYRRDKMSHSLKDERQTPRSTDSQSPSDSDEDET